MLRGSSHASTTVVSVFDGFSGVVGRTNCGAPFQDRAAIPCCRGAPEGHRCMVVNFVVFKFLLLEQYRPVGGKSIPFLAFLASDPWGPISLLSWSCPGPASAPDGGRDFQGLTSAGPLPLQLGCGSRSSSVHPSFRRQE